MQTDVLDDREALETGLKITVNDSSRFLEYHEAYGVLICVKHGYAVRNLTDHLKRHHSSSKKERTEVLKQQKHLVLRSAKEAPLPPPLQDPFSALGTFSGDNVKAWRHACSPIASNHIPLTIRDCSLPQHIGCQGGQ